MVLGRLVDLNIKKELIQNLLKRNLQKSLYVTDLNIFLLFWANWYDQVKRTRPEALYGKDYLRKVTQFTKKSLAIESFFKKFFTKRGRHRCFHMSWPIFFIWSYSARMCWRLFLLRYYAAFKVRKLESLFYKVNMFLQTITTCIGLETEQILSINIWHAYFNFGRGFYGFFSMLFLKAPACCGKKILK